MRDQDKPKILHLTLHRGYFDEIVSGDKREEYRDVKPYWTKRIEGKTFDEIHFRNGYAKGAPFMRVQYQGWKFDRQGGKRVYALQLGPILELKNHPATGAPAAGVPEGEADDA